MLLFLHGFLGHKDDWDVVRGFLPKTIASQAINLPGHGGNRISQDLIATIKQQVNKAKLVVGYSAGGRIALELKQRYPTDFDRLVLISTHLGLHKEEERRVRLKKDEEWIQLLEEDSLDSFLEKWYSQELFQSLKKHPDFPSILCRRKNQDPKGLKWFLEHFSLGKKTPAQLFPGTYLMYGQEDLQYANLYRKLNAIEIKNAGHALHLENPKACARIIEEIYHEHN